MAYEKAMEYRDLIRSIQQITEKQKVTSSQMEDRDVIGLARAGNEAVVQVFFIRNGRLIGRDHYYLTGVENESRSGVLTSFVKPVSYTHRDVYKRQKWRPLGTVKMIWK